MKNDTVWIFLYCIYVKKYIITFNNGSSQLVDGMHHLKLLPIRLEIL
jgi:hypothetical protein